MAQQRKTLTETQPETRTTTPTRTRTRIPSERAPQREQAARRAGRGPSASAGARPLSARSVIASTLLGMQPPQLPARLLVASGELFGIAEGTTRVALSRMVANGELEQVDGSYQLVGRLRERQQRQLASREARHRRWAGDWELVIVTADRRDAASRAALRDAMRRMKLAELREGVWTRPDNLDPDRSTDASVLVAQQCERFVGARHPQRAGGTGPTSGRGRASAHHEEDRRLVAELWDLDAWARDASAFRRQLAASAKALAAASTDALAPGFVLSAAVLRHLLADPELPDELVPTGWVGPALRADYDAYDATFKAVWRDWFRSQV